MSSTPTAASAAPRAVLADLLPGEALRDVLLVLGGAAFVGIMAQISVPLPWTPVPLTGQTLAVLCVGAALGPVRGAASLALYLAAGVAGMPWFADGQSGWGGPSFGYVLGFVVSAGRGGGAAPGRAPPPPGQGLA